MDQRHESQPVYVARRKAVGGSVAAARELIEDYRYYVRHLAHRRSDVWCKRRNWAHLKS